MQELSKVVRINELIRHLIGVQQETQRMGLNYATLYIARAIMDLMNAQGY